MTNWIELNARARETGLPEATRRQVSPGVYRYSFVHQDIEVDDPAVDASGRFFVSPREYGFAIRGFDGGKTAWARDFANGSMLVVNAEGISHVLSPKMPARILFVTPQGMVVQDTGNIRQAKPQRVADLATVRLTISATFDMFGESHESARTLLMRMVDRAILAGVPEGESKAIVVGHTFEAGSVLAKDHRSSDTDFSQLLDL